MIQFVVSLVQHRPVVVVQWLAHLTGIFRVSGPAPWGEGEGEGGGGGGRGRGAGGLYFYICLNPLEIFIAVCVHAGICPVSISIFSSFFQEIIHNGSFSFFPRGEVEKLKFFSNSQIGPYLLMPIATSPISDVASLTQPSPQQPVVL